MRQILSSALVALIVGSLAGLTVSAMAQSEPAADPAVELAGVNADTVDGRHAVGAGASPQQRRNKLVATDASGQLPANIVKPPWNRITGKPEALADGQIDWGEVGSKPGGFADGVDNQGVTKVTLTTVFSPGVSVSAGQTAFVTATCPAGSKPTGGGGGSTSALIYMTKSYPIDSGWVTWVYNASGLTYYYVAYAVCLSTTPAGGLAIASKGVEPAFMRKRN